jgi:acetyl esterase/lipase
MRALAIAQVGLALLAGEVSAAAPAGLMHETTAPERPVGTVIVIHGGGWQQVGEPAVNFIRPQAARFVGYGWRAVNVDHRRGYRAVRDVVRWYDYVRARYAGPICAFGESSGAHLALMLAVRRDVDCLIGHGAITDLTRVGGTKDAARLRERFVRPSFGRRTAEFSPVRHARRIEAPVLLATSENDTWARCVQMRYLKRALPSVRTYCLRGGDARFIHARVSPRALERQHDRERALLARVAAGG